MCTHVRMCVRLTTPLLLDQLISVQQQSADLKVLKLPWQLNEIELNCEWEHISVDISVEIAFDVHFIWLIYVSIY